MGFICGEKPNDRVMDENIKKEIQVALREYQIEQNGDLKKLMINTIVKYIGGMMLFFSTLLVTISINSFKRFEKMQHDVNVLKDDSSRLEYHTGKLCDKVFNYNPFYKQRGSSVEK